MQLAAFRLAVKAQAQGGVPSFAALLGQQPRNERGVFGGVLQHPAGELQLLPDVGVIVGGTVAAVCTDDGGELLPQQVAGAPFRGGKGEPMAGHAVHGDLGEGTIADAVQVDAEGLLHMGDGPLQIFLGLLLGSAGGLHKDGIITALVAGGEPEVGILA